MALYEVVREIENQCSRNQMRDVFFDEIETDDPLEAVRALLKDEAGAVLHMERYNDENLTVYADCSGVTQKFLFTKI
ncbi:MAG: hypothetical protein E7337_17970 [Clostridiales bacterium]|nr:hypothetical protein [Clostridiales bacterium]